MDSGRLEYNAQSPDEAALVSAAKNFGYVFKARSPFSITVHKLSSGEEVLMLDWTTYLYRPKCGIS